MWINVQREVKNEIGLGMWCSSKPVEMREDREWVPFSKRREKGMYEYTDSN
jgi:hypothetical protein